MCSSGCSAREPQYSTPIPAVGDGRKRYFCDIPVEFGFTTIGWPYTRMAARCTAWINGSVTGDLVRRAVAHDSDPQAVEAQPREMRLDLVENVKRFLVGDETEFDLRAGTARDRNSHVGPGVATLQRTDRNARLSEQAMDHLATTFTQDKPAEHRLLESTGQIRCVDLVEQPLLLRG